MNFLLNDSEKEFDIYVVCLKNGILPYEKSILYYNKYSTEENSLIYPGCDQSFIINP